MSSWSNPKEITSFAKLMAAEVRVLLDEIGKLREERRTLQYEIAELMSVKSKHGAGGAYAADWQPPVPDPGPGNALIPAPAPEDAPPVQVRPGWRVVHKRPPRKERAAKATPSTPAPNPPPPVPKPEAPAWSQWRPNPLIAPTPVMASPSTPAPSAPPRVGLFGNSTPPPT